MVLLTSFNNPLPSNQAQKAFQGQVYALRDILSKLTCSRVLDMRHVVK